MVIDGLRSDHLFMTERDLDAGTPVNLKYSNNMPYLSSLLNATQKKPTKHQDNPSFHPEDALAFEVITAAPTVTLPRILVSYFNL